MAIQSHHNESDMQVIETVKNIEPTKVYVKMLGNVKDFFALAKRKESKQVISLYASMLVVMVLGFVVSVVNTRLLGPKSFGDLKFIISLFTFVSGIIAFGFLISSGRLIALRENDHIRDHLIGAAFTVATILSIATLVCIFLFSFVVDRFFNTDISRTIRLFSPLLFVFPFTTCIENIAQGANRIHQLAFFRVAPQFLYLIGAIMFNYYIPLSLTSALSLQLGIIALVIAGFVFVLKPDFSQSRLMLSIIFRENKRYGFHVYLGSLAGVTTASLLAVCLGYFVDTKAVGFFSLAVTIATPLMFVPNVIGITLFNRFTRSDSVPSKAIFAAICLTLVIATPFFLFIHKFILFFYSNEYSPVIPLVYFTGIGCIFHGFGELYNRFLSAHGRGRELRNGAYLVGVAIVLSGFIFLPLLGTIGAAVTRLITGVVYFVSMLYYYKNRYRLC